MIGQRQITLTADELAELIVGTKLRWSGTCLLQSPPLINSFWIARAETPDGILGLWYDNSGDGSVNLYVRGAIVLTTPLLSTNPAGSTFSSWDYDSTIDWSIWYDTAGGARSMGIRWGVNGAFGFDTVGVAVGPALAAPTEAFALGSSPTDWQPTSARATGPTDNDVVVSGVYMGDSITAPYRSNVPGTAQLLYAADGSAVVNLAQTGATAVQQLATYNASRYKTDTGLAWGACMVGVNDIGTQTAATTLARIQAIVDAWNTDHPGVPFFVLNLSPLRFGQSIVQYQKWVDVNEGINGGGATPITGAYPVSSFVAAIADSNNSLLYRYSTNDHSHPNAGGRALTAAALKAAALAQGVVI